MALHRYMTARLLVSLSGVDSATLEPAARFADRLGQLGVPLSLLVAPRAGEVPVRWVRERVDGGDALVLHGYNHDYGHSIGQGLGQGLGNGVGQGLGQGLTNSLATGLANGLASGLANGLGGRRQRAEFAGLPAHEAGLRLLAALRELERLRLDTTLFAPPSWRGSAGTLLALRHHGFEMCADLNAVHVLATGVVHRGRVLTARPRGRADWWGPSIVLGVTRAVRRGEPIRVSVGARDLARRTATRQIAIDAVKTALAQGAVPATYADFAQLSRRSASAA